ncbi:MAG: peptidoglycan D,D-transpeptidase FtsI family protein, partial [Verrucomicrobiota bacterium]
MDKKLYIIRALFVLLLLLIGFTLLGRHFHHLQITRHAELLEKARGKYTTSRVQTGSRGMIYDSGGNLLTGNLACKDVLIEPRRLADDRMRAARLLSNTLDLDLQTILGKFNTDLIEIPLKRRVDIQTAQQLAAFNLPGVRLVNSTRRFYPKGKLAANLLGIVNSEGDGVSGIEQKLNSALKPASGVKVFERTREGSPLPGLDADSGGTLNGADVYLTLNEPIQSIMEEELENLVEEFQPQAAYAIMAEPESGAILGVAQHPSFDPNIRSPENMKNGQWQNHFITGGFEPGSIMKPISLAGALDYGVVTLGDIIDCEEGHWRYRSSVLRDAGHSYDDLRVWQVLQKSSNIGIAKISLMLGEERLYQTLWRFGFGRSTGLFANEASGILRPLPNWDWLSVTRFPIGQGLLATPAQIIQAYNALANGGVMAQLRIVDRLEYPHENKREHNQPQVKRRVIRPQTARLITTAMKTVVSDEGTAPKAAIEGYPVAGKTGTSQKFIDGTYQSDKHVASFIGFVPAHDPEFVLLVVADEPEGSIYGGTVAAPTFKNIA